MGIKSPLSTLSESTPLTVVSARVPSILMLSSVSITLVMILPTILISLSSPVTATSPTLVPSMFLCLPWMVSMPLLPKLPVLVSLILLLRKPLHLPLPALLNPLLPALLLSSTPTRTPSPSGPCVRFCTCPSFTCAILYDNPYSFNDVDLGFRTSQEILDDSDEEIVYVPVPTVTIPTVTVPTVIIPSVTVPSVTFDYGSGSSGASTLIISFALMVVALVF